MMKGIRKYTRGFIWVCAALAYSHVMYAQSVQKGKVVLLNSGKKCLPGVQVIAWGAQPTDTDQSGTFQLTFQKAAPGDPAFLKDAYKKGYELVNGKELREWVVSFEQEMVIVMSPTGTLKAMKEKYYHIGNEQYLKRYQATLAEIEKQKKKSLLAEKVYEEKLEEAYQELNRSQQLLSEYAASFASINQDDLSSLEKKAFLLLEDGKLDEAIALYENEKLLDRLNSQLEIREKAQSDLTDMVASLKRYAEICAFAGGTENLEKAEHIYRSIALSDLTHFDHLMDYALFLDGITHYQEALNWLDKAMVCAGTKLEVATVFYQRGIANQALQHWDEAGMCYQKAYSIWNNVDVELLGDNQALKVASLVKQSHIELEKRAYTGALDLLTKAEVDNRGLQKYDSLLYVMCKADISGSRALVQQTEMFYNKFETESSRTKIDTVALERNLLATITDYEYLVAADSMQYVPRLVNVYFNLGSFYQQTGRYALAEKFFNKTRPIREAEYKRNPGLGQIELATLYINMGKLYDDVCSTTESDTLRVTALTYYEKALAIRETMAQQNPRAFSEPLARAYHDVSVAFTERNDTIRYFDYAFKCIGAYEKIIEQEPAVYGPDLIMAYWGVGLEYDEQNKYSTAVEYYDKILQLIDRFQLTSQNNVGYMVSYSKLCCYALMGHPGYEAFMKESQEKHGADNFDKYSLAIYYYQVALQRRKDDAAKDDAKTNRLLSLCVEHYAAALAEGRKITNEADMIRSNYDMLVHFMVMDDQEHAFTAYRNMSAFSAGLTKKDYQENEVLCEIYGMGAYCMATLYANLENWQESYNFFAKAAEILVCRPEERFRSKLAESLKAIELLRVINHPQ